MLRSAVVILFLLACYHGHAQVMEGLVLDQESSDAIPGVTIINKRSGTTVFSSPDGQYSIQALAGDTLLFRHTSYLPIEEIMTFTLGSKHQAILMHPLVYKLKEATVVGQTKYQQDSTERHEMFHHELTKTLVPKPKYLGLACAGCIGWIADKITGNSKKPKRFRKHFAAEDEAMFIDTRYNTELVTGLTGIKDPDSAAAFIYKYPMEYAFARSASDLEIKAWIRNNYRDYLEKGFVPKQ